MMYNQKMVASIKVKGKILREFKDTVYIPFGSEYSILIKNLNNVRCIVNVFIDGDNIVPGGLVITAGQTVDLERSIKNGNLQAGNKLKFIERTSAVENGPRGIKLEDGLIRIEYQFEKVYTQPSIEWGKTYYNKTTTWPNEIHDKFYYYPSDVSTGILRSTNTIIGSIQCSTASAYSETQLNAASAQIINDIGITVAGSRSDQKFCTTSWFPTEAEKHSIVIKLLGATNGNKQVTEAVTVKHKPRCQTCGKFNKATAKFCQECGTALEIIT